MKIKNVEDLAAYLGAYEATEASISHRVYKDTTCGAWAKLEDSIPVGRKEKQNWKVDIRRDIIGYRLFRARRAKGRRWYTPAELPPEVVDFVAYDGGLDDKGYILDEYIIDWLKENVKWHGVRPAGRQKYFDAELDVFKGKAYPGVSFGSIVEGVDACTQVYTVTFPCTGEDIWNALQQVEDEASDIWDETHACPDCHGGIPPTYMGLYDGEGCGPVDPNCPSCHGQGMVI